MSKEIPQNKSLETEHSGPPQGQISALVNLYNSGQMIETEQACRELLQAYPQSLVVLNVLGGALSGQSKLKESVQVFEKAIQLKPDFINGHYNRGNVLKKLGQLDEAVKSYDKAIQLKPDFIDAYRNRGNALNELGDLDAALLSYDKAIQLKPDYAEAYNNRGDALEGLGRLEEALKSYDKAIECKSDYAAAYSNRGVTLKALGLLDKAIEDYDKATQLKPDYAEAYNNKGVALEELAQLDKAMQNFDKAIQLKPDFAEVYNNRGSLHFKLGQMNEAMKDYDKAIRLKPDYAKAYYNRGNALTGLAQPNEALKSYDKAIQLAPDFSEAYNNRGSAHFELGQMDEAMQNFDLANQLKPQYAEAHMNRGNASRALGQLKEAIKSYEKAIQFKPDYGEAHLSLAHLKTYNPDDPHTGLMENLLTNSELSELDRMNLYVALAKVREDIGDYDDSFSYLEKANRLRNQELDYTIDNDRQLFARIKETFSVKGVTLDEVSEVKPPIRPIFIIGMPRSGTSLAEQILATHSKVHGAGELEIIGKLMSPITSGHSNDDLNQDKAALTSNEIASLRHGYLESLAALNVPETIIVDKMPYNFLYVGFILFAFPNAKIIHLDRDPIATCWSIYKHFFASKGNGYAYDMGNLAEYYSLYIGLMSFWRELFPESIYELCYEDLTENQEEQSRKILEFCELDWEEQCLEFYKTERTVKTASAVQVRQKMYKGSSKAWRKYENHLQTLINGLQDHRNITN